MGRQVTAIELLVCFTEKFIRILIIYTKPSDDH